MIHIPTGIYSEFDDKTIKYIKEDTFFKGCRNFKDFEIKFIAACEGFNCSNTSCVKCVWHFKVKEDYIVPIFSELEYVIEEINEKI